VCAAARHPLQCCSPSRLRLLHKVAARKSLLCTVLYKHALLQNLAASRTSGYKAACGTNTCGTEARSAPLSQSAQSLRLKPFHGCYNQSPCPTQNPEQWGAKRGFAFLSVLAKAEDCLLLCAVLTRDNAEWTWECRLVLGLS